MFFSQTIRDLFSKINHTNEAVSRIDKDAGIVANSQEILINDFQALKDDFKKHVSDPQGCTSQGDISFLMDDKKSQNGKIDNLAEKIANLTTAIGDIKNRKKWSHEWKTDLVKFILLIVAMGTFLITYDKWRTGKQHVATITAQPISNTKETH